MTVTERDVIDVMSHYCCPLRGATSVSARDVLYLCATAPSSHETSGK